MGFALECCERWDEAIETYERALASENAEVVPLAKLGIADSIYLGKGDRAAAATMYRQLAVPEDQGFADYSVSVSLSRSAMEGLASLLFEGRQLTEADEFCERLSRGGGSDAIKAAVGRARIAATQGRTDEAQRLANGLDEIAVADLAGLRYPLYRVDSFAAFNEELTGGRRELTAP